MLISVHVQDRHSLNPSLLYNERVEGTEDYVNGYLKCLGTVYPESKYNVITSKI